jgi:hypothetical protein
VYTVLITAGGYQTTRSNDVYVTAGEGRLDVQTAVGRATGGLRTIGGVQVAGQGSLQTTTTINEHLDPSLVQDQSYARTGDALKELPFVTGKTASALGARRGNHSQHPRLQLHGDLDASRRPSDRPDRARGNGFDYSLAPFWGLSGVDVTMGSGAA